MTSGRNQAAPATFSVTPPVGQNVVTLYPFNNHFLYGLMITSLTRLEVQDLFVQNGTKELIVLTNLGPEAIQIEPTLKASCLPATSLSHCLPPLQSVLVSPEVILSSLHKTPAGPVSLIQLQEGRNLQTGIFSDPSQWKRYPFASDDTVFPLWISRQLHLAMPFKFNPWTFCGHNTPAASRPLSYEIYTNLWWLPAGCDAGIHTTHHCNFLEIHTQLIGTGRMQKFQDLSSSSSLTYLPVGQGSLPLNGPKAFPALYEEYRLAPGATHPPFPNIITSPQDGKTGYSDPLFLYPPHQYYADTDSLWITFEYHRAKDAPYSGSPPE